MKKLFMLLLTAILAVMVTACGKDEASSKKEGEAVEVDKGILNVEITLPALFFENDDVDQAIAEAKESGVGEVIKNDDGSLTYKMSKSVYNQMMKEMDASIKEYIEEMKNSADFVSIQDITHNKSFSEFTLVVDQEQYESSFDGFAALGFGMSGLYYQVFSGQPEDDQLVTIFIEDEGSGEVLDTIVFPDDLEETEEQ